MEVRDWKILRVLSQEMNITKTAEIVRISQPALTKRLQLLEGQLGIKIVHRVRRGVQFTPEGEYLAKCSVQILARMREMKDHISNMDHQLSGTLRIGASNFFTRYKLPHILKLFKDEFPQAELKVISAPSAEIYNMLYRKEIHVAFVRGDYAWHDRTHLLLEEKVCIVSSAPVQPENLPDLPRIDYVIDRKFAEIINRWWAENYKAPPKVGMVVDTTNTCKEMVLNGLGYAIMPGMILADMKNISKIAIKDKEGNPIKRNTWMLSHNEFLQLNLVNTFVHFVEALRFEELE